MPREVADLLQEALSLSADARVALADALLESLDSEVDADADQEWRHEVLRRLQQVEAGAVELVSWEDAKRRLRAKSRS
jgi:putative addiction module component (TIGR02574 family)